MKPHFDALRGRLDPADIIPVSKAMTHAVHQLNLAMSHVMVDRVPALGPLQLVTLATPSLPTGVLAVVKSPQRIHLIEWLYLASTPPRNIYLFSQALADLIVRGQRQAMQLTEFDLLTCFLPISIAEHHASRNPVCYIS
uniref:Uncharacterized protein n=1 Tax=Acrobeloides nanus TaxID=290746 RepID=A0A914CJB2_9BILA